MSRGPSRWTARRSCRLLRGEAPAPRRVISEYTDMGVIAPCRMVRDGRYKYLYTHGHPAQLFDLADDPLELRNRAGDPALADVEAALHAAVLDGWDADAVQRDVLASQRRRLFLKQAQAATRRRSRLELPGDPRRQPPLRARQRRGRREGRARPFCHERVRRHEHPARRARGRRVGGDRVARIQPPGDRARGDAPARRPGGAPRRLPAERERAHACARSAAACSVSCCRPC